MASEILTGSSHRALKPNYANRYEEIENLTVKSDRDVQTVTRLLRRWKSLRRTWELSRFSSIEPYTSVDVMAIGSLRSSIFEKTMSTQSIRMQWSHRRIRPYGVTDQACIRQASRQ